MTAESRIAGLSDARLAAVCLTVMRARHARPDDEAALLAWEQTRWACYDSCRGWVWLQALADVAAERRRLALLLRREAG